MNKKDLEKIPYLAIPYVIGTGLFIGGMLAVPHQKKCDLTSTYHVHLYTKEIGNVKIQKWLNNESSTFFYAKQDDFLKATTLDLEVYDKLDDYNLFQGLDNMDFINYQILSNRDYMKFYYSYEETRTIKDSEGKTKTVTETHSGWSENPRHRGVTGKVRVHHKVYYAYKLVYNNKDLELEKSNPVDDIRTIINEYPYISENTNEEVTADFKFKTRELPYLNLEDFDPFYQPTIENNPLENNPPVKKMGIR